MKEVIVDGKVVEWYFSSSLNGENRYVSEGDIKITQDIRRDGMTLAFRNTTGRPIKIKASCEDWDDEWEHLPYAYFIKEFGEQEVSWDLEDLISKGAIPPYENVDPDTKFDPSRLTRALKPMATEYVNRNMPGTGQLAGDDVGLMPREHLNALLTGDRNLLEVAKAYSYGGATIGWHGEGFASNGWQVDEAHQPSFHYIPYLLTKQRIFLDLLHWQADYNIRADKNLLDGQIRSRAWKARSIIQAAYITPKEHPKKSYYLNQVERLKRELRETHVTAGELTGVEWRAMSREEDEGFVSPWENDYLMLVLCWAESMGLGFKEIIESKSPYFINRFIEKPGWPIESGTAYRHKVREDGAFFTEFPIDKQEFKERYHNPGHAEDLSRGMLVWLSYYVPRASAPAKAQDALLTAKDIWNEQPKWALRFPQHKPKPNEPVVEGDLVKASVLDYGRALDGLSEDGLVPKQAAIEAAEAHLKDVMALPTVETILPDQISKAALDTLVSTMTTNIANLPTADVGGVTGVEKSLAQSEVNTLKAGVDALPILQEDPPPPGVWQSLFVNPFTNGFDGGASGGTFHQAENVVEGAVVFQVPEFLKGPEGTIRFNLHCNHIREKDIVCWQVDESGILQSPKMDIQYGGNTNPTASEVLSLHPILNGGPDEADIPRWHNFCQWMRFDIRWINDVASILVNGVEVYVSPNVVDFTNNNSVIAFNVQIFGKRSNGKWKQSHLVNQNFVHNARGVATAISDAQARADYLADYAALTTAGLHVDGEGPTQTVPTGFILDDVQGDLTGDVWTPDNDPLVNLPAG